MKSMNTMASFTFRFFFFKKSKKRAGKEYDIVCIDHLKKMIWKFGYILCNCEKERRHYFELLKCVALKIQINTHQHTWLVVYIVVEQTLLFYCTFITIIFEIGFRARTDLRGNWALLFFLRAAKLNFLNWKQTNSLIKVRSCELHARC